MTQTFRCDDCGTGNLSSTYITTITLTEGHGQPSVISDDDIYHLCDGCSADLRETLQ